MFAFIRRMFALFMVTVIALSVSVAVLMLRIIAHYGSRLVEWCAKRTGIDSPFENVMRPQSAKVLDSSAIETLINSKIPTKAERAAARAALDAYMA